MQRDKHGSLASRWPAQTLQVRGGGAPQKGKGPLSRTDVDEHSARRQHCCILGLLRKGQGAARSSGQRRIHAQGLSLPHSQALHQKCRIGGLDPRGRHLMSSGFGEVCSDEMLSVPNVPQTGM